MGPIILCVGVVFVLVGVAMVMGQGGLHPTDSTLDAEAARREAEALAPISAGPNSASRRRAVPARTSTPPPANKPPASVVRPGNSLNDQFFRAKLGQTITFNHPQRGGVTGKILGTIEYVELWQRVNKSSEPWVPTGNSFAAHWLGSQLLYEWQSRLYVLDEYQPLSDTDIQQSFMPYAKRYAQSNQSAQVTFAWPPASWTIVDIGKFRVARAEGEGLRLKVGAEGRFIHASGADHRALVVEDYQTGQGGQDTAWIGSDLSWEDIQRIG